MDNPKILLRSKGKEQINISQFTASSSQEFQSIQHFGNKINFQNSLEKSKFESDLKETDINTSRLESYLLDSLWSNLHNSVKYEERNPVVQSFQPYTLPVVQIPPTFQHPPPVPNRPR